MATDPRGSELARHWDLDPAVDFLNHGSFGACPRVVLEAQRELRQELEAQPVAFLARRLETRFDAARETLAGFLGARAEDLVVVPNATAGVNTVLRSLDLEAGDELLTTTHVYNACRNALDFVARDAGARVVAAEVPFPLGDPRQVVEAVLERVGPRTRLALLDHVTSPTGLVFPIAELVAALAERGVDTLVDGAHAPGMLDLDLDALGAAYYTGNCHKWLCAPKASAFLHVRRDRQDGIEPLVVSHGANLRRPGRSRFHDAFDWGGTHDPTPFLAVPVALDTLASLVPGGWPEVRRRNHALALAGRKILCRALGAEPPHGETPSPESMIGSLAAVRLPDGAGPSTPNPLRTDPLQQRLVEEHGIEVPIFHWDSRRWLRISAQLYNDEAQYERLAAALAALLEDEALSRARNAS